MTHTVVNNRMRSGRRSSIGTSSKSGRTGRTELSANAISASSHTPVLLSENASARRHQVSRLCERSVNGGASSGHGRTRDQVTAAIVIHDISTHLAIESNDMPPYPARLRHPLALRIAARSDFSLLPHILVWLCRPRPLV